jgi:hypothetical protein
MLDLKIDHVEKSARNRSIFFSSPQGLKITYFGDGRGFESVKVNDKTVNAVQSKLWYVPTVEFNGIMKQQVTVEKDEQNKHKIQSRFKVEFLTEV